MKPFEIKIETTVTVEVPETPHTLFLEGNNGTISIEDIPDDMLVRIGDAWTKKLLEAARAARVKTAEKKKEEQAKKADPLAAKLKEIEEAAKKIEEERKDKSNPFEWPRRNPLGPLGPKYGNPAWPTPGVPFSPNVPLSPSTPFNPDFPKPDIWCGPIKESAVPDTIVTSRLLRRK